MKLSTICEELRSLDCPHCSSVLRPANPVPAGKKVRCPKCAEIFTPPPPPSHEEAFDAMLAAIDQESAGRGVPQKVQNKAGSAGGPSAPTTAEPKKTPATNVKLTRAQAEKFLDFMPERLTSKCVGTLYRLKPNATPDYYNRANVQLRQYVLQIKKIWTDYFNGIVSEAQAHSLGTIYDALLNYSRKLYTDYVKGLGRVDGGDGTLDSPQPAEAGPMYKKNFNYHKSTYAGGAGRKVTAVDWLKNFLTKKNVVPWLRRHKLADRVRYFTPILHSDGGQSMVSADDKVELKSLVNDIYSKLVSTAHGVRGMI